MYWKHCTKANQLGKVGSYLLQEEIFTEKQVYAVHQEQAKELYFQSNHSPKFVSAHAEKYVCPTFIGTSHSKLPYQQWSTLSIHNAISFKLEGVNSLFP